MPNLTRIEREWGMLQAQKLLEGQITLSIVDGELRGFNLTRIDFVRLFLHVGQFGINHRGQDDRDLYADQSRKTAALLEKMIKDRLFGLSTVNYLWDNVGNSIHTRWKEALCEHLTPAGLYALLMTEPSEAFRLDNTPLTAKIAPHIPAEKQEGIVALAKKGRKLAALYQMTGWQACRDNAKDSERDAMMGSDLGL